jgi:hypothetical protein
MKTLQNFANKKVPNAPKYFGSHHIPCDRYFNKICLVKVNTKKFSILSLKKKLSSKGQTQEKKKELSIQGPFWALTQLVELFPSFSRC